MMTKNAAAGIFTRRVICLNRRDVFTPAGQNLPDRSTDQLDCCSRLSQSTFGLLVRKKSYAFDCCMCFSSCKHKIPFRERFIMEKKLRTLLFRGKFASISFILPPSEPSASQAVPEFERPCSPARSLSAPGRRRGCGSGSPFHPPDGSAA